MAPCPILALRFGAARSRLGVEPDHHVVGLDVAVHDAVALDVEHRSEGVLEEEAELAGGEAAGALKEALEVAGEEWHHDEGALGLHGLEGEEAEAGGRRGGGHG